MATNFPDNPILNDEFTASNRTWIWDGSVWLLKQTVDVSINTLADTEFTNLADGEALVYNSTTEKWENGEVDALPDQTGNSGYYLTTDGSVPSWAPLDITATTVSETAPTSPEVGDAWFRSSTAQFFIYYDNFWVEVGAGPAGEKGDTGVVNATAPLTYDAETQTVGINYTPQYYGFSYNRSTGKLIIEYNSIDNSQPAVDVSTFEDWFMANEADSLNFQIVNGHLIMESV